MHLNILSLARFRLTSTQTNFEPEAVKWNNNNKNETIPTAEAGNTQTENGHNHNIRQYEPKAISEA
jgi:hypothetical protein